MSNLINKLKSTSHEDTTLQLYNYFSANGTMGNVTAADITHETM